METAQGRELDNGGHPFALHLTGNLLNSFGSIPLQAGHVAEISGRQAHVVGLALMHTLARWGPLIARETHQAAPMMNILCEHLMEW